MSLINWIGFSKSKRQTRRRTRRQSISVNRKLRLYGGALHGIECLELRDMLNGLPAVVDRSGDPGPDTIDVSTSGANTLVSVNGTNVYTGASLSISSLTIIGSPYEDHMSFDYTAGNPVPNGTISVDGNDAVSIYNSLSVTANAGFNLDASGLTLSGGDSSVMTIKNINDVTLSGNSTQMTVDGWHVTVHGPAKPGREN